MPIKHTLTFIPAAESDTFITFEDWVGNLPEDQRTLANEQLAKQMALFTSSGVEIENNVLIAESIIPYDPSFVDCYRKFLLETNQSVKIDEEKI